MSRSFARAAVVGTLAFGALVASASSAQAQTVASELNFNGAVNLYDAPGSGGANLFIDFLTNGAVPGAPLGTVTATELIDGEFAGDIAAGDQGVIRDLTISDVSPGNDIVGAPIGNFLTFGGYTFELEGSYDGNAFGPVSLFPVGPNSTTATFAVFGNVTGGAFGATGAYFEGIFTAQFNMTPAQIVAAIDQGPGLTSVAFSATFNVPATSVVPEPSTYLLMATGLGMIGLVGYRRRSSQS